MANDRPPQNRICLWYDSEALINAMTGSDRVAAKQAFDAMMTMKKIDVATIETAIRGL